MKQHVKAFNSEACGECPVRTDCAAGRLIDQVEDELLEHARNVFEGFADDVAYEVMNGDEPDLSMLCEQLAATAGRAAEVTESLEEALKVTSTLKSKKSNSHIQPDDREVALEHIEDALDRAPHPTDTLTDKSIDGVIEAASNDIPRFVRQGICKAVVLVEN